MFKTETINAPMRLCYHRLCHYNSIVDPVKPTIGVGLGLPGYNPGSADRNQVKQAVKNSEADLVEKTMLEDKIKATGMHANFTKRSSINHVVKILVIFDPLPPSWSLLLNKAYVIKWSFG